MKIYVIKDRASERYYQHLSGIAFKLTDTASDATHFEFNTDLQTAIDELQELFVMDVVAQVHIPGRQS